MSMHPAAARAYWKALLDNSTSLIRDAHLLLDNESYGRARSLTVLAEEELGKALSVYETFENTWTLGNNETHDLLRRGARDHLAKYRVAFEFGRELEAFWGSYPDVEYPKEGGWETWSAERSTEAQTAASQANQSKQRGFYVDLVDGKVLAPTDMNRDDVSADLGRAAQVIEMMLIKDHSRMKDAPIATYDGTHDLQWRVMPTSHPEEFADFVERIRANRSIGRRSVDPPNPHRT